MPSAAASTRVGVPELRRKGHRQNSVAQSHGRAAAAKFTGIVNTTQTVKKAVTTLLRNSWKRASLQGFGPQVFVNGGVKNLASRR